LQYISTQYIFDFKLRTKGTYRPKHVAILDIINGIYVLILMDLKEYLQGQTRKLVFRNIER